MGSGVYKSDCNALRALCSVWLLFRSEEVQSPLYAKSPIYAAPVARFTNHAWFKKKIKIKNSTATF